MNAYVAQDLLPVPSMTTCDWLYAQATLTEQALENAQTAERIDFLRKRLLELQGRVRFEQRMLALYQPDAWAQESD